MKITATQKQERLLVLDVLRGFALLGILFANMSAFKSPIYQLQSVPRDSALFPADLLNQWSTFFIDFLVTGKFYPLFSFLFGLGFYFFYERLKERGTRPEVLYKRRMLFMLALGLAHLLFLWSGDILHTYAVTGFLLLLFINRPPRTIIAWGCGLLIASSLFIGSAVTAGNFSMEADARESAQENVAEAESIYSSGSYLDILEFRLHDEVPVVLSNLLLNVPNILGLFLIGLYVGKKGWVQNSSFFLNKWKKIMVSMLLTGGLLSLLFAFLKNGLVPLPYWLADGAATGLNIACGPLLMLFYVSGFVLLCRRKNILRLLKPFAMVGQMALTNYILQTVVCMFIFYGFGLQLFGTIDAATGVLITLVIFAAQLVLSSFWMGSCTQGPLEALWRRWTYRKAKLTIKS